MSPINATRSTTTIASVAAEFTAEDSSADELAGCLAKTIDATLGWYCDFRTATRPFVVFSRRVFRYPCGDAEDENGRQVRSPARPS